MQIARQARPFGCDGIFGGLLCQRSLRLFALLDLAAQFRCLFGDFLRDTCDPRQSQL